MIRTWLSALLVSSTAFGVGCGGSDEPSSPTANEEHLTQFVCSSSQVETGQIRPYFAPFDPVEEEVLCALDTAQREVVVAHYNIRRQTYLDKLVELSERGVRVKVAVDVKNAAKDYNVGDDFLEEHGIELIRTAPSSYSLMHLKVTVIDEELVMTGSFNWNGTAALANDENMVVMRDERIAEVYRNELLEVYGDGPHAIEGGPVTESIDVHFAPEERLDRVITGEIGAATQSIDVAMFTLTESSIRDALIDAAGEGIAVRVITERKQAARTDLDERLEEAGIQVVRAANRIGEFSAMHHKYAVLDGDTVITGATNWTRTGTRRSEEDLLIVRDADFARAYRRSFADLLHVYAAVESDGLDAPQSGVLFRAINEETAWGDRMVVTGNDPALGSWNPWEGIEMETTNTMFPNWTANATLPAGKHIEYKFVRITSSGEVHWEEGDNRRLQLSAQGRAAVTSGPYGDTSTNWTPLDE